LVGATEFEPATSRSQSERSTRLSYAPTSCHIPHGPRTRTDDACLRHPRRCSVSSCPSCSRLAKLCASYDIPVPPRGYWTKKAAGKRVTQPRLPAIDDPYRQKVHFAGRAESTQSDQQAEEHQLIRFERDPTNALSYLPTFRSTILSSSRRNARTAAPSVTTADGLCLRREFFTFTPLERSTLVPCASPRRS
jgi:hypothetical protein